jgi:hypothetical protein
LSNGEPAEEDGLMAAMKVTTSAAMRARDVSRPHAEHLALAEASEASAVAGRPAGPARVQVDAGDAEAVPGDQVLGEAGGGDWPGEAAQDGTGRETEGVDSRPGRPGSGRRRWRSRGSGGGRPRT